MTESLDPITLSGTPERPRSPASLPGRVAAFIGGLVVLLLAAVFSFGVAVLAPAAMWVAARVQRRRGRVLGVGMSWLVAAGTIAVVFALLGVLFASMVPQGVWRQFQHASDSAAAAAARQPPPAWMQRVAPGALQQSRRTRMPPVLQTSAAALGAGFGIVVMSLILGTIAWAAGMLLGFGVAGHWPRTAPLVSDGAFP